MVKGNLSENGSGRQDHHRPPGDPPEECCGHHVATLSTGNNLWLAAGSMISVKEELFPKVQSVLSTSLDESSKFSLFVDLYMAGNTKSTALPYIIFMSESVYMRKRGRKVIRKSGLLREYPFIKLGDSASLFNGNSSMPQKTGKTTSSIFGDGHTQFRKEVPGSFTSQSGASNSSNASGFPNTSASFTDLHTSFTKLAVEPKPVEDSPIAPTISTFSSTIPPSRSRESSVSDSICSSATEPSIELEIPLEIWAMTKEPDSNKSPAGSSDDGLTEVLGSQTGDESTETARNSNDSFSFSDNSETHIPRQQSPWEANDPPHREIEQVAAKLLEAFDAYYRQLIQCALNNCQSGSSQQQSQQQSGMPASSQGGGGGGGGGGGSGNTAPPTSAQLNSRKRGRREPDPPDVPPKKRANGNQRPDLILCCPYWKRDPLTFSACFKYDMRQVRDVKQHLRRRHQPPIRCSRCETIFDSNGLLGEHLRRDELCVRVPRTHNPTEMNPDKMQAILNVRADVKETTQNQWFRLWDVLFEGEARPKSAFHDPRMSAEVAELRAFAARNGVAIVRDYMRLGRRWTAEEDAMWFGTGREQYRGDDDGNFANDADGEDIEDDEDENSNGICWLERAIGKAVDEVFERWLSNRSADSQHAPIAQVDLEVAVERPRARSALQQGTLRDQQRRLDKEQVQQPTLLAEQQLLWRQQPDPLAVAGSADSAENGLDMNAIDFSTPEANAGNLEFSFGPMQQPCQSGGIPPELDDGYDRPLGDSELVGSLDHNMLIGILGGTIGTSGYEAL